ncbi:hypothetical protein [Methylobacterium planeticum]|uniref:Uncharacterized protein n=1 Tax=Methylobacterium planeticum TaxID=2615211 RepID=A0A6N6MI58_9HYPH|nr:hypothetical protein [Methylobacterium planeticum]KAB1070057.1 hypothetical protein F6X51_24110 [Methylobacterium planeticum]
MMTLRAVCFGVAIGLCGGVAVSAEVDQMDGLTGSAHQETVLNQKRPAGLQPSPEARLPELGVAADASRRGLLASTMDKPWNPHICIGC